MATAAAPTTSAPDPALANQHRAEHAMRQAMLLSFGAGFIPVPTLDVVTVSAVQLRMLHDMSNIYGIPFREDWGKAVIGSILGSLSARWVADSVIGTGLKLVPIAGSLLSYAMMPTTSAAATYALGKVFIQHFESGGTFLDFDPSRVRAHFAHYYAEGKRVVASTFGKGKDARATT